MEEYHNTYFWLRFALLAIVALIAFAPHCCRRSSRSRAVEVSPRMVDTMTAVTFPHFTFRAKGTCAICLEDYKEGEIINVLPCKHEFHSSCVGSWLTEGGTLCPVCRLDLRTRSTNSTASRTTPVSA